MLVTSLGHAGLLVQGAGGDVLCDPWFSPEGAFLASWFQFPENQHLLTDDLLHPTAVVISHEHLDHVDPWFLARVPPEVPVVIPEYPSPVLREKVLRAGTRPVVEVPPWGQYELASGIRLFFVSEQSPMNHDSAIVLTVDGRSLLNMNDARMTPAQLARIRTEVGGKVDVLALQAAGASWYPICYEYSPETIEKLAWKKRLAKLHYVARVINLVEPVATIPFAGPPCFLDQELFHHNDQLGERGIFPDQFQVVDWLMSEGIRSELLLPGDSWDALARMKLEAPEMSDFSRTRRSEYLEAYAGRRRSQVDAVRARHPQQSEPLWERFQAYFHQVLQMSYYFNERIDMRVGFEVLGDGGGSWAVDFRPEHFGVFPEMGDCQYRYRLESRWLPPILERRLPWEDFFLSLRFSAWRHPDLYNDHLLGLLKFAVPDALEGVEAYESGADLEESIVVKVDGRRYRIQRYCPHAGQDFTETAELLPGGILHCLGHHFEFDLETGECLTGGTQTLRTQRLD